MQEYQYYVLNVFSDIGLIGGNQLAVIPDASGLSDEEMLIITREFNFSESTFVINKTETEADVRIFTPGKEIEYAGHPTVGTLNVLETLHREHRTSRDELYINLKGGRVKGLIETSESGVGVCSFTQQTARFVRHYDDRERLLDVLGLAQSDLEDDKPFNIIAVTDMKFLFVQVKDSNTLHNTSPDFKRLAKDEFLDDDINIYVFTTDAQDNGTVRARFFVPLYGIDEDPATGGIQSSFGLCLNMLGILQDNHINDVVVEQGYEMGRPSKIYNKFDVKNGELVQTITGGNCIYFSKGTLWI